MAALLGVAIALTACGAQESAPAVDVAPEVPPSGPMFVDRATELGIDFVHDPGFSGELRMPEILGAGVAMIDIDGDGDLDLLLIQSNPDAPGGSRLYRNLLVETGELAFEDVTDELGLHTRCYGTGVAAADFDNDGDVDLYITCYGTNELWRNDGAGGFTRISDDPAVAEAAWTGTAGFFDFDGDGLLDLYVGNYLDDAPATRRECRSPAGVPDYCGPLTHRPAPDRLLRNVGDGRFEDVTERSGIASGSHAPALGVVAADFDGDGRLDFYVANDAWPNRLWINQGDGRFVDNALIAGVAVNSDGQPEGSMGVDAGDYDGDGHDDLVMVHIAEEKATLYVADGRGMFEDRSAVSGLAALTRGFTGFGAAWIDYDNDGWLDLLIVNGRVRMDPAAPVGENPFPYAQRMLLLHNRGDGRFVDDAARGGPVFAEARVSRGAAFGDLDNDGDLDVVVNNANGAPFVLINQVGQDRRWLGVRLVEHGRDAHGARAGLKLASGRMLWRRVRVDGSYVSANDPRLLFGLGDDGAPLELTVIWADGVREAFDADRLRVGDYVELTRGTAAQP